MTNTNENINNGGLLADIIRDFGDIPISETQKYRVLLVRDPDIGVKISAQKWYRTSPTEEWKVGKGFFLSGRNAIEMGKKLQEAGQSILHVK